MPTETFQELLDLNRAHESEATEIYIRSSFKDVEQVFLMELRVIFSQFFSVIIISSTRK
jgi:hypothetical protein